MGLVRFPSGCGNPKCAYTKYKLGLLDDDAEMELKFLPPPLTGILLYLTISRTFFKIAAF